MAAQSTQSPFRIDLDQSQSRWRLAGIAFLVLLAVATARICISDWSDRPAKPNGDGLDYENIAFHLWTGQGYWIDNQDAAWRSIYLETELEYQKHLQARPRDLAATGRPPLLPTLIAGTYCLFGRGPSGFLAVHLLNGFWLALAGASAVWMVTKVMEHAKRDEKRQVLAACVVTLILAATHNTLASYALDFLTEPLALALTQLFICVALSVGSKPSSVRWKYLVVAGILLGLMILCRSVFVAWLPGIACLAVWSWQSHRAAGESLTAGILRSGRWTAVMIFVCLAVCIPWWARNCAVLDSVMPLGTQGTVTLIGGYSDAAVDTSGEWTPTPEQELRTKLANNSDFQELPNDTLREIQVAEAAKVELFRWIQSNWTKIPAMAWGRIVTHWNPYSGKSLLWKVAIILGIAWVATRTKKDTWVWLVGLPILSTATVAILYSVGGRFLVPMYGLLFGLAGIGCAWCIALLMQLKR